MTKKCLFCGAKIGYWDRRGVRKMKKKSYQHKKQKYKNVPIEDFPPWMQPNIQKTKEEIKNGN